MATPYLMGYVLHLVIETADLIREETVHHLAFAMAPHLSHYRFVAFDTVGDAVGELQLRGIVELT